MSWLRFFRKDAGDEPTGTGYGVNPYDTYTWELHTEPDGERHLRRAHLIDSRPQQDGETFNPYDTGKFSGGW